MLLLDNIIQNEIVETSQFEQLSLDLEEYYQSRVHEVRRLIPFVIKVFYSLYLITNLGRACAF